MDAEDLKSQYDIRQLVRDRVELRRRGGRWWGRCPFHDERTASFMVDDDPVGRYHCFGCGVHGDALDWRVWWEGRSVGDLLREADGRPRRPGDPKPEPRPVRERSTPASRRGEFAALALRHRMVTGRVRALAARAQPGDFLDDMALALEARELVYQELRDFFAGGDYLPWREFARLVMSYQVPIPDHEWDAHRLRVRDVGPTGRDEWVWALRPQRPPQSGLAVQALIDMVRAGTFDMAAEVEYRARRLLGIDLNEHVRAI